jgi:hypothetical protein
MKIYAVIAAESFSIDQATNRLSAFNLFDDVNIAAFPMLMPQLAIIALCERDETDPMTQNLELAFALDAQELGVFSIAIDFQGRIRARAVANIQGLVITGPGRLKFMFRQQTKILSTWETIINSLGVQVVTETSSATGPSEPQAKKVGAPKIRASKKKRQKKRAR